MVTRQILRMYIHTKFRLGIASRVTKLPKFRTQVSSTSTIDRSHAHELHVAIQGKDCLVQKFRNSSVMLEAPHYRPKVRKT